MNNKYTLWFRNGTDPTWHFGVEVPTAEKALELQNYARVKHPARITVKVTSDARPWRIGENMSPWGSTL